MGLSPDGKTVKLQMVDMTTRETLGRVFGVKFRCGQFMSIFDADIFPGLAHDILLGLPWLIKENPHIDFRSGKIQVLQGQDYVTLPTVSCPKQRESTSQVSPFKDQKNMLMVVIKPADDDSIPVETIPEDHEGSDVEKLKRQELPAEIIAALEEYSDVFAKDLPSGVPPVQKGHQFHIELEPGAQPVNRPLYKLSPLELEEVKR